MCRAGVKFLDGLVHRDITVGAVLQKRQRPLVLILHATTPDR
jgi:hypothetical protein